MAGIAIAVGTSTRAEVQSFTGRKRRNSSSVWRAWAPDSGNFGGRDGMLPQCRIDLSRVAFSRR
jgi:hypothetical protein